MRIAVASLTVPVPLIRKIVVEKCTLAVILRKSASSPPVLKLAAQTLVSSAIVDDPESEVSSVLRLPAKRTSTACRTSGNHPSVRYTSSCKKTGEWMNKPSEDAISEEKRSATFDFINLCSLGFV